MQMIDQMLASLTAMGSVQTQTGRPVQDAPSNRDNSFRTLLEQKQNQVSSSAEQRPEQAESQPEEAPSAGIGVGQAEGLDAQALAAAVIAAQAAPVASLDMTAQAGPAEAISAAFIPLQTGTLSPVVLQSQPAPQTAVALPAQASNPTGPGDLLPAQATQPQSAQAIERPAFRQDTALRQTEPSPFSRQQTQPGDTAPQGIQDTGREEILLAGQGEQPIFREVEAVPVKVGESASIDTASPSMDSDLASVLDKALQKGEQRVEIKLSPASLGTVTVEMTRTQDGSLHVTLHAASSRAGGLLESHVSALEGLLAGTSQAPVHVEVQRQADSQQPQHYPQDNGGQQQGQQQNPQQHNRRQHSEDFLQQLRLGLVPLDAAV